MIERWKKEPVTVGDLVLVMFIGLKISHQIDWSWWWVTSPAWIMAAIVVAVAIVKGGSK